MTNDAKKTGPRKVADVSPEIIDALHRGERETRDLVEWLAMDSFAFAKRALERLGRSDLQDRIERLRDMRPKWTAPKAAAAIGIEVGRLRSENVIDDAFVSRLSQDAGDVARSFACYAIGSQNRKSLRARLKALKPLAADRHAGVREMAWMAIREAIIESLDEALIELSAWSKSRDANVRRFASEATRPRGVWCRHIEALKVAPERALPLLEPLRSDESPYVRASVGNWLNDASKTCGGWVETICERWLSESPTKETQALCRRALRTLRKVETRD